MLSLMVAFTIHILPAAAKDERYVIPGGETIGLKLDTGVYVAGKYQVQTPNGKVSPWKNSDIQDGDKILAIDEVRISSNQELLNYLQNCMDDVVILTLQRSQKMFDTNVEMVYTTSKEKSIGLYIRDRLLGVGTLTFIDPDTQMFASLGHGIYDAKTMIGSVSGNLLVSKIEGVKKATPGNAGEKRASLQSTILGTIKENSMTGVYGLLASNYKITKSAIPVASQDEVVVGKAKILTVIDGTTIETYEIEIINVNHQNSRNVKGLKIKVTDPTLIEKTGGIIQGMSGSPIIQNGKLVGAVSHVTVDNPEIGYGMHIDWMLQDIEKIA